MKAINPDLIVPILRILARKGVSDVLSHMKSEESMHYNEIMNYLLNAHIIKSRAAVTTILCDLTDYELLEKTITEDRRTCYRLSKNGSDVIDYLKKIEEIAKKN